MATASQLLEFDANGNCVREMGKNLNAWSYAHAVRVDPQDNIWVVDEGSSMILRFTPEGPVPSMGLGSLQLYSCGSRHS